MCWCSCVAGRATRMGRWTDGMDCGSQQPRAQLPRTVTGNMIAETGRASAACRSHGWSFMLNGGTGAISRKGGGPADLTPRRCSRGLASVPLCNRLQELIHLRHWQDSEAAVRRHDAQLHLVRLELLAQHVLAPAAGGSSS